jgi:hypothetical protein
MMTMNRHRSREQAIRDEAYAIWEAEGRPVGRSEQHWREAERRLAAQFESGTPADEQSQPTSLGDPTAQPGDALTAPGVQADGSPAAPRPARAPRRKKIA